MSMVAPNAPRYQLQTDMLIISVSGRVSSCTVTGFDITDFISPTNWLSFAVSSCQVVVVVWY